MHFLADLQQLQLNHILTAKLDTKLVYDPPLVCEKMDLIHIEIWLLKFTIHVREPIYFLNIDESTKSKSESIENFKICIIKVA